MRRNFRRQRKVCVGLRRVYLVRWHTSSFTSAGLHENENQENKPLETPEPREDPYAKHSRSDAKVWSLYMMETEAEDKELVQSWKTGLDSLLVFVLVPISLFFWREVSIFFRRVCSQEFWRRFSLKAERDYRTTPNRFFCEKSTGPLGTNLPRPPLFLSTPPLPRSLSTSYGS